MTSWVVSLIIRFMTPLEIGWSTSELSFGSTGEVSVVNPGAFPSTGTGIEAFKAICDDAGGGQYANHLPLIVKIGISGRFRGGTGLEVFSSSGVESPLRPCCKLVHSFPTQLNR
jgi:hypothetical protein